MTEIPDKPYVWWTVPELYVGENRWRVAFVFEDTPGYYPTGDWPNDGTGVMPYFVDGETLTEAQAQCYRVNANNGVSREDTMHIIASSMRAQFKPADPRGDVEGRPGTVEVTDDNIHRLVETFRYVEPVETTEALLAQLKNDLTPAAVYIQDDELRGLDDEVAALADAKEALRSTMATLETLTAQLREERQVQSLYHRVFLAADKLVMSGPAHRGHGFGVIVKLPMEKLMQLDTALRPLKSYFEAITREGAAGQHDDRPHRRQRRPYSVGNRWMLWWLGLWSRL